MQGSAVKRWLYKVNAVFSAVGTTLIGFSLWLVNAELTDGSLGNWPLFLIKPLRWIQDGSFFIPWTLWGVLLGIVFFLLGYFFSKIRSPKDWQTIQYILDKAQKIAYPDNHSDPKHHHRVTLFRYEKWAVVSHWSGSKSPAWKQRLWPWGVLKPNTGWLVPVARSGHTAKGTKTRFAVKDGGASEGISGLAWSGDSVIVKRNLPVVKTGSRQNRNTYADQTNCPREMIDYILDANGDQRKAPQSLGAVPIHVGADLWGILVFDSQSPVGVSSTVADDFQISVGAIEQILERG